MTAPIKTITTIRVQSKPLCVVCGNQGTPVYSAVRDKLFGAPGEWSFARCSNPDCRLLWLDPSPLEEDIQHAYATYYTHAAAEGPRSLKRRFLSASLRWLTTLVLGLARERRHVSERHLGELPPGRLLDVGCGDGRFLHSMKQRGWSVTGTDFDEQAAQAARQKYGINVSVGRLGEIGYPDNGFDAITMNHVIEHLFDPVTTLREVCRILRPGGVFVATTPNADSLGLRTFGRNWRGLEVPRHIHVFSSAALEIVAQQAGLQRIQVYSSAANASTMLSESMQLSERQGVGALPQASIGKLLKALAMTYQEARMNASSGRDGEENVLLAFKGPGAG